MEEPGEKGLKRAADSQTPEEECGGEQSSSSSGSEGSNVQQPAKRPALSSSFSFRPSPLHKATQGLVLRQSSLTPPSSSVPVEKSSPSQPSQVGFLKLDNSELKPGLASSPASSSAATNGSKDGLNHTDAKSGSFTTFIQSASAVPTFSSLSSMTGSVFGRREGREREERGEGEKPEDKLGEGDRVRGEEDGGGGGGDGVDGNKAGCSSGPLLLPEVQRVTGEEGEKKIVQISARLYAFDASTHSWKERGRGDIRLNDTCQREGLFQSRLVMRASGSYRVLFNTHLWAEMKCEKANQKTIRITAQDGEDIAVFLLTGNTKDIQQLFNAIDHRVEALRLNARHTSSDGTAATSVADLQEKEAQSRVSHEEGSSSEGGDKESGLEEEEEEEEEAPSSPESPVEESHKANIRQKAVSLPSDDNSGCEEGEGGEREGEGVTEREGESGDGGQGRDREINSTVQGTK